MIDHIHPGSLVVPPLCGLCMERSHSSIFDVIQIMSGWGKPGEEQTALFTITVLNL
jgi:hypothetical protein